MRRPRTTVEAVLESIRNERGSRDVTTARRLFQVARRTGAELRPAERSVSVRVPGIPDRRSDWLTIFVVSEVGTFYTNWTDRWVDAGVPMRVSRNYLHSLQKVLGASTNCHPTAYRSAIPLSQVSHHLKSVSAAVTVATRAIKTRVKSAASKRIPDNLPTMACYEGVLTEVHLFRRTRSRRLRRAALAASRGVCATCGVDFSQVLGGRGKHVLQAHHRKQLADTDRPRLSTVDDIAILCANCHLLVHYDRQEALDVDDLKAMLDAEV